MRSVFGLVLFLVCQLAMAGYDFHITRKAHWSDEGGPKISFSEWTKYVKADKQVVLDDANGEHDFLVQLPSESFPIWYNPQLGELYTKNPSENAVRKLIDISKKLKATVQGDDGELYPAKP